MVLERSFDSADLKRLLMDSQVVMDRSLVPSHSPSSSYSRAAADHARISRPPLPKGSRVFEKVLDEFQPERQGPEIRVSDTTNATTTGITHSGPEPPHHHHRRQQQQQHHHHPHLDHNHLSPYYGRSRSNSRSEGGTGRCPSSPGSPGIKSPSSPRIKSPSRPGSPGIKSLSSSRSHSPGSSKVP